MAAPEVGTEVRSGLMRRLTVMGGCDVAETSKSESESEMEKEEAGETNRGWEKVISRKKTKEKKI